MTRKRLLSENSTFVRPPPCDRPSTHPFSPFFSSTSSHSKTHLPALRALSLLYSYIIYV